MTRAGSRRGDHASPACLDGRSEQRCAHGAWAPEDTTREDADLGCSHPDHATRRLLSHSPAVSLLVNAR